MIEYDRYAWWRVTFSFHGTVLPRILGRVGLLTGLSLALCMLDAFVLQRFGNPLPALDQLGHTVLGVALGMLIVFRTNTAHARYWDARIHWGAIINASRNLARTGASYGGPAEDLARFISAFAIALRQKLRGSRDFTELRPLVGGRVYEEMNKTTDAPAVVTRAMSDWVRRRSGEGRLSPPVTLRMEELICSLVDHQGGCERILRTPMPFAYASLIKQILLLYLASLPFVLVAKMGFAAPLVVAVVAIGMLGIEDAGVELENPFSTEPNALPLEVLCDTIAKDVAAAAAEV